MSFTNLEVSSPLKTQGKPPRYLILGPAWRASCREGVTPFPVAALRPAEMEMTMRQSVPQHH